MIRDLPDIPNRPWPYDPDDDDEDNDKDMEVTQKMADSAKMKKVMALAASYRKKGMNPKEALKKAWKNV